MTSVSALRPIRRRAIRSIGASRERPLGRAGQEPHPVVEEVEAGEAVADEVEIGAEAGDPRLGQLDAGGGRGGGAEAVDDPDLPIGDLVRIEVRAHEDGAATAPGAALDQVALDALDPHRVQARLEVFEAPPPHRGVRQERRRVIVVGTRGARPLPFEPFVGRLRSTRAGSRRWLTLTTRSTRAGR